MAKARQSALHVWLWAGPAVRGTPSSLGYRDLLAADKRRVELRLNGFQQKVDEAEGARRT